MSSQAIEPSIKAMFQTIWTGLGDALAAMPRWEKGFHIFWLLGPLILLIEHTPADIWEAFAGWCKDRANVVAATGFLVPFGLFFPLHPTVDFYGQ